MTWADLAIVAGLVVLWTVVSGQAERIGITAPMVFTLGGLAFGAETAFAISLSASTIRITAEITLVLILFSDSARLRLTSLRHDVGLPARLLGIGLPLTVVFGALAAGLVFGGLGIWFAVLAAACLAPTDAGLGSGIVTNRLVPSRIRRTLNVESGLNDGIVAPLVSLAVAILVGESSGTHAPLVHAVREIGVGALVGVGVGLVAGWVFALAVRKGWAESGTVVLATPAAAIGTYALAVTLHGNGFVAAFLAGLCFGIFRHHLGERSLELTEGSGQLLACVVWFAFGAAMLRPSLSSPDFARILLYAVLSLTVVRLLPVCIALYRTHLGKATVAFIGWFGPRGLASVIFALLAFDQLGQRADLVLNVVSITVALSILLHGFSSNPLIARYGSHAKGREPDHPLLQITDVPAARRTFGSAQSSQS
jgi:NhaP-type Na+/H+ or K+/H+ antiporter